VGSLSFLNHYTVILLGRIWERLKNMVWLDGWSIGADSTYGCND